MNGFFITGTGTEIGKTVVTAVLSFGLKRIGKTCLPVKAIGAGGINAEGRTVSEDAVLYQQIAQINESLTMLNPFCLQHPSSPHFAAETENTDIPIPQIIDHINLQSKQYDIILVEGVGGWLVPLRKDYWIREFSQQLGFPLIIVSANVLGAINHTLLTIESVRGSGQTLAGVIFTYPNQGERSDIQYNNIQTIEEYGNVTVLGEIPYLEKEILSGSQSEKLWDLIKDQIQWQTLMNFPAITPNK